MPNIQRYGGVKDAAQILDCSEKTVRRRIADGSIPAYRMPGRSKAIRIRLDDLEASLRPIPSGQVMVSA